MTDKSHKLGIVADPIYLLHNPGIWHPESPQRLAAVDEGIDSLTFETIPITARAATRDELLLVHTPEYVDAILNLKVRENIALDPDTVMSEHTQEAALKAVGGVLEAIDRVLARQIDCAFCAVRPPGHHAEPDRPMGFCIFNNDAIGAAYAIARKNLARVAIVDWDLHHGNGTQKAFYESDRVLYISTHQFPYYPGTGATDEIGAGAGIGFNINLPMHAGANDNDFREAFNEVILPALTNFEPELLFISAGFDAHYADPLGGLNLTTEFFGEMTRMLKGIADKFCDGMIVSVLEGGYDFSALRDAVALHLEGLHK